MIGVSARVTNRKDVSGAFDRGLRKGLLDVGQVGFNASQDRVANEATDEGMLLRSGFGPKVDETDLSIIWGYSAPYAEDVDKGTPPHHVPLRDLWGWTRRTFGISSVRHLYVTARGVQKKIAEKGTDPTNFIKVGKDTMEAKLASSGLKAYIEEEL